MKFNLQFFGGRGASSATAKLTSTRHGNMVTYTNEYGESVKVQELTRQEAISQAQDFIDGIATAKKLKQGDTDTTIWVQYKDGSHYMNYDGDVEGKLKKSGITHISIDDGYQYYIYGKYKMNDNLIIELVED